MEQTLRIEPPAMVSLVASALRSIGFAIIHRSKSRSRYLKLEDQPYLLRLSDHVLVTRPAWGEKYPCILDVVLQPAEAAQIPRIAADIAMRYLDACDLKNPQNTKSVFQKPHTTNNPPHPKHPNQQKTLTNSQKKTPQNNHKTTPAGLQDPGRRL